MVSLRWIVLALVFAFTPGWVFGEPIDINTADAETLADSLSGVGGVKAAAIVAYREQHGPFKSVEDLTLVTGIGSAIVDKNRDALGLGAASHSSN